MKPKNDILNYIQKRERKEGRDKGRKVDRALVTYLFKDCPGQWKFWFGKAPWLVQGLIILPTPGAWLKVSCLSRDGPIFLLDTPQENSFLPGAEMSGLHSGRVPSLDQNEFFP